MCNSELIPISFRKIMKIHWRFMIKLEDAKTKHFNWKFKQMLKSHKETCVHRNIGITIDAATSEQNSLEKCVFQS